MENQTRLVPGVINPMSSKFTWRIPRGFWPLVYTTLGCLLFIAGNLYFVLFHAQEPDAPVFGLVNLVFYTVLSGIVILGGKWLAQSDISVERHPRAGMWLLSLPAALFVLNIPGMYIISNEGSLQLSGWALSLVTIACAAGTVIGLVEARAIEQAQMNQRLRSEREAHKNHVEQLEYLNHVLRHEVLNNVSIIKGYAELALEGDHSEPATEIDIIRRQSTEMTNVVTDIRILLETLQDRYTCTAENLSRVLAEELASVQATTQGETIVTEDIPEDLTVMADPLLDRVFGNLLSNAVEHNESAIPEIDVTVDETPSTITVHVADNGSGIPVDVRETLFDRPNRGDSGRGLYLTQELVDRYGGRIELTETGPDGSVFSVTLNRATTGSDSGEGACLDR